MFFWPIDMPHVKVWLVVHKCILVYFVSSMLGWDTCTCAIILIVDVIIVSTANHGGAQKQFVIHMNEKLHFPNSSYNILHVHFIYTLMHLIHAISCCISTFNAETFSTSASSILHSVQNDWHKRCTQLQSHFLALRWGLQLHLKRNHTIYKAPLA